VGDDDAVHPIVLLLHDQLEVRVGAGFQVAKEAPEEETAGLTRGAATEGAVASPAAAVAGQLNRAAGAVLEDWGCVEEERGIAG